MPTMPRDKRVADSVKIVRCGDPDCGHPHVLLCDTAGEPFAEAVLSDAMLISLLAARLQPLFIHGESMLNGDDNDDDDDAA
jgi:hypothetical protein